MKGSIVPLYRTERVPANYAIWILTRLLYRALIKFASSMYKAWDRRVVTVSIMLDLSKDSKSLGINTLAHSWVQSNLHDHGQITKIDVVTSRSNMVSCKVLQGSILGPLLFFVFISDGHE